MANFGTFFVSADIGTFFVSAQILVPFLFQPMVSGHTILNCFMLLRKQAGGRRPKLIFGAMR